MSDKKKLPDDRFVIRPDIDQSDDKAIDELADDITAWVLRQRERVQKDIADKKAAEREHAARESASALRATPIPMAAKGRG
jgi:hypothetical protein